MRRAHRRHLPLALLLACALLGAQWLGAAHRIAHAPGAGEPVAAAHQHDSYGHERDSADCRVLDHLLGAAPMATAPSLVLVLPAPVGAPEPTPGLAPQGADWRQPAARGPPVAA